MTPAAQRRRIRQQEGQLLVAQLEVLLEQGTAQRRIGAQSVASGLLDLADAEVRGDQANRLTLAAEPIGHRLQLATDLVLRKQIE